MTTMSRVMDSRDSSCTNTSSFRSGLGRGANSGWEWGSRSIRYPPQLCICTHVLNNWHNGQLRLSLMLLQSSNTAGTVDFMVALSESLYETYYQKVIEISMSNELSRDWRSVPTSHDIRPHVGICAVNAFKTDSLMYYQALRNDHTSFSILKNTAHSNSKS